MEFITCADLHINSKVPKNRKGGYLNQCLEKFKFLLKTTEKTDSKILVVAGDFFDAPSVSYKVTRAVMEIIRDYNVEILVVPGQHDLRYHVSGLENTPLGILESADIIHILKNNKIHKSNGISFIGAGWNEIPEKEACVLVTHQMVIKKEKLWSDQTNYSTAHSLLRKYSWAKIIVSGDNHLPHTLKTKSGKLQVNCGSMVRSTKTQINFQPRIQKINTDGWKVKLIKIPIIKAEQCFDFQKITIEEMKDEAKADAEKKIAEFISTLPQNDKERPNFKKILSSVMDHAEPKDSVKSIINETMERISA